VTEYTAASARAPIEEVDPLQAAIPDEQAFAAAAETLEGLEELLTRLPAPERREAISGVALESGETLWVPTARNCRLSAGIAVKPDGLVSFVVGDEGSPGGALATHRSARAAAAHALGGPEDRAPAVGDDDDEPIPGETTAGYAEPLLKAIKAAGWAIPAARRVDDLDPGLLARVARLSEAGVAHLFAEGGGVVLAIAGSTAADRRRAAGRLARLPERPRASRQVFGVLLDAGERGSHYSEEAGWGLSAQTGQGGTSGRVLEATAERFRLARDGGSLAVAETRAEHRRIEANRRRMRAEFVARRRCGEELVVRPAREIHAGRAREAHWTDDPELRSRLERARSSGRAAYDTARAVYLQRLPTLAHRLLHLLRREGGAILEEEFVSRHAKLAGPQVPEPEAAVRTALRELADAGKVRRLRSRATGEVFLTTTQPLDEGSFRRSLNGLIHDARYGIVNPWTEVSGVEPEGGEDEGALLDRDPEDTFPEETGHGGLLETVAGRSAQEELEDAIA